MSACLVCGDELAVTDGQLCVGCEITELLCEEHETGAHRKTQIPECPTCDRMCDADEDFGHDGSSPTRRAVNL